MFRTALCALFTLAIVTANVRAEDIRGQLKKVDADKGLITLTIGPLPGSAAGSAPAEKEFKVGKDAKIVDLAGKEIKDGLKAAVVKPGAAVIVTTSNQNGGVVVTQVKIAVGANALPGAPR